MAQRLSSDQALSLGPEQLTALLNSTQELLALLQPDGSFLHANENFSRLLGYPSDQLVGASIFSFLHPNEASIFRKRLESRTNAESVTKTRVRLQGKDGSWRWFEAASHNHLDSPQVEAITVSLQDVTDLHRMEFERQVTSDIVHALNDSDNLDELLISIHAALKKVLYAENCFVALHCPETDTFEFRFWADQFDPPPPPQKISRTCTAFVFRAGRAMIIDQPEFDRLAAQGEVDLVGSSSPAWLGVPLKTPTATIGVLVVQHYSDATAYNQRDLEFLDSVGGHIALAIERRRAEDALTMSESMFRLLFAHNPLPTWVFDSESLRFLQINDSAVAQYGYSQDEFEGMTVLDICPASHYSALLDSLREWKNHARYKTQWKHVTKDGRTIEAEIIAHQLEYNGRAVHLVVAQDVGERHQLEEQLRQAQKMEAVGRLAGGVAHDFNNLLMVIKGHTELLMNVLPPSDAAARKIEQIDRAADRATSLTRQLLAFSRMQVLQPRVTNLNTIVEELGKLIPRLIGEDIELVFRLSPDLGAIRADASQMEQIIMNLAVNARDAMPGGGRLLIETSNAELDRNYTNARPVVSPGPYVLLAVSDNGIGMNQETQARIFEPFFTTKEQGKGTGLGLSTVYGVVKQSGGFIWCYSELGKGTSFKIYLPRIDQKAEAPGTKSPLTEAPRGTETILLAEDEHDVRELAREFLESGGYKVIEATNGKDALRIAAEHTANANGDAISKIDLLLTDMVMPGMTGQQLAARLQHQYPGLNVIYMSGYSEHAATESSSIADARLLTKPFSRNAILRAVRETLGPAKA
jgi:two-component system cell cycle sensor histidine kinase/response regulator CckA